MTEGVIKKSLTLDKITNLYQNKQYFLSEKAFLLLRNSEKISDIEKARFYIKLALIYASSDFLKEALTIKKDIQKSLNYIKKASSLGHAHASYLIGWSFEYGNGFKIDYLKAKEYYELAIKQDGTGWYKGYLGRLYLDGRGVSANVTLALKLFEEAANANNDGAQFLLGEFYENGNYVEKNIDLAIYWYKKAANNGDEGANKKLKQLAKPKKTKKEIQA